VDVVASFVGDAEPAVVVEPGGRALDDPALFAEPGAVWCLGSGDLRTGGIASTRGSLPSSPSFLTRLTTPASSAYAGPCIR